MAMVMFRSLLPQAQDTATFIAVAATAGLLLTLRCVASTSMKH